MSEMNFINILRRAYDEKVKVRIRVDSQVMFIGYITEIGDDYVKVNYHLEKKSDDSFILLSKMESISTEWKEK